MSGSGWVEIVFLAMLAGFIALRLVSVLGRRTGHEQRPIGDSYRGPEPEVARPVQPVIDMAPRPRVQLPSDAPAETRDALAAIAAADPRFDPARFTEGAKGAYRMILEAFWKGDIGEVEPFVVDEVAGHFRDAIAARGDVAANNRLVAVDSARITAAHLLGAMAEVTVRFEARIATGSGAANPAVDEWTFRRHVSNTDPNWLLVATDEA